MCFSHQLTFGRKNEIIELFYWKVHFKCMNSDSIYNYEMRQCSLAPTWISASKKRRLRHIKFINSKPNTMFLPTKSELTWCSNHVGTGTEAASRIRIVIDAYSINTCVQADRRRLEVLAVKN